MMRPYPPAWSIIPQTLVRKERKLGSYKVTATPLVSPGQDVVPDQPILRWQNTGQSPLTVDRQSLQSHSLAPSSQELVLAGLYGRVVEIKNQCGVVIESHATLVQGVIGAGDQVVGPLILWLPDSLKNRQTIPSGAILVVPEPLDLMFLRQSVASGVAGIVASSIALRDLEGFLHVDLIEFLQEERTEQRMLLQHHFPPLTLLFTEGLALDRRGGQGLPLSGGSSLPEMPANVVNTLTRYDGAIAVLSGEPSLRNVIVPELIISLPPNASPLSSPAVQPSTLLIPGAQVRVYGG